MKDRQEFILPPGFEKVAVEVVDKVKKGAKHLLEPIIVASDTVTDASQKIAKSSENGNDKISSFVCGSAGAIAKGATTVVGDGIVFGTAAAVVAQTRSAGLVPASIIANEGFKLVHDISEKAGDLTQSNCHAALDAAKKLDSEFKTKLVKNIKNVTKPIIETQSISTQREISKKEVLKEIRVMNKPEVISPKKLNLICDFVENKLDQQKYEVNRNGLITASDALVNLAKRHHDNTLLKLGTVAQTGLQINLAISAIKAGATIGPMFAIPLLLMNAIDILWQEDDNGGSDLSQFFIEVLGKYCESLHNHIDLIHDDLSKKIIRGFSENRQSHGKSIAFLKDIYYETKKSRIVSRDRLDTLSNNIQALYGRQRNDSRTKRLADIYKYINLTTGPHQLSTETFISLFNEYKTDICNIHKKDSTLIGLPASKSVLLKDFEDDNRNLFSCDFNIRPFHDYILSISNDIKSEADLINPTVYSWQILGKMELLKRRYKQDEKALHKISKTEVKVLEEELSVGQSTLRFTSACNNKELLKKILDNYLESGNKFLQQLKLYIIKQEAEVKNELYRKFIKQVNGFDKNIIDQFISQEIKFNTQASSGWFAGRHTNNHPNFREDITQRFALNGKSRYGKGTDEESRYGYAESYVNPFIDEYLNERKKSVNEFKSGYSTKLIDWLAKYQTEEKSVLDASFKFDLKELKLNPHYYYRYAMPHPDEKEYTIILPLPDHYQFNIPIEIQIAEWLGIGSVKFEYAFKYAMEKKDNNYLFNLKCIFVIENQKYEIASLVTPFNPSIYKGNEALWWWWIGGNYSKEGVYLNWPAKPKDGWNWWGWVIGLQSMKAGDGNTTVIRRQRCPESNMYLTFAVIPYCTHHKGKRDEIEMKEGKLINAESGEEPFGKLYLSFNLPDKIKKKLKDLTKDLYENISREILNNEQSELTKSLIEYSFNFYLLKYSLFLSIGQDNLNFFPVFDYFYHQKEFIEEKKSIPAIRNRLDLLLFLKQESAEKFTLLDSIELNLQYIKNKLPLAIKSLSQVPKFTLMPSLLSETLSRFESLIAWYRIHSVDENQLVTEMSQEAQKDEADKLLLAVREAIGEAVLGLPTEHQNKFMDTVRKNLLTKGLLALPHIPTLFLPAPTNTDQKHTVLTQSKYGLNK